MNTKAMEQLSSIESMLMEGHRSVRMEIHTLLLWGLGVAFLILFTDDIFHFLSDSKKWIRISAVNAYIAAVLLVIAAVDLHLTRRVRQHRAETISFVQLQVLKIWWFLLALMVLLHIGMALFGGGYLFLGLVMILTGFTFYIHGLFSQQTLSWTGGLFALTGLLATVLKLPHEMMIWLSASAFGLGLPLTAVFLHYLDNRSQRRRILFAFCWIALVLSPLLLGYQTQHHALIPQGPVLSLEQFRQMESPQQQAVVHLPADTAIPLTMEMKNQWFSVEPAQYTVRTLKPMDLVINNGKADGRFRIAENKWLSRRLDFKIEYLRFFSRIDRDQGPNVTLKLQFSGGRPETSKP